MEIKNKDEEKLPIIWSKVLIVGFIVALVFLIYITIILPLLN